MEQPSNKNRISILFKCPQNHTKIDHILVQKNKPQNFKRIEILYSVFSDHNRIKLEIINRETKGRSANTGN